MNDVQTRNVQTRNANTREMIAQTEPAPEAKVDALDVWVRLSFAIGKHAAGLAMVLLAVLIVPAVLYVLYSIGSGVYLSIYRLGMVHFAPTLSGPARKVFEASVPVVAGATVGMPYCIGVVLFLFHRKLSNTAKGYSAFFMFIGVIELVLMYFYEQALTLSVTYVPIALVGLGALIYAGIGGLNLIPALVVPIASYNSAKDKHATIPAAVADCLKFMLEGVLFIAGVAAEFYFGLQIGLPSIYVGVAAFLVGLGFVWAGLKFVDAHKRGDRFDMREWSKVRAVFGGYLAVVGALAVAELATGHKDAVPTLLKDIGVRANFFVQAILVFILLYTERRTAQIDDLNGDGKDDKTGRVISIGLPSLPRLFTTKRQPVPEQPALPVVTMQPAPPAQHAKVSETGKPYDITGTFTMSQEAPEIPSFLRPPSATSAKSEDGDGPKA